MVFLLPVLICP